MNKMTTKLVGLLAVLSIIAAACGGGSSDLEELNVAYFLEWPTANQVAQVESTYDEALGLTVNWIPFPDGGAMTIAMEAGEVDIAYSQGLTPFANAVSNGSELEIVGVAVAYADADNCAVQGDLNITAANATELEGMDVYSPIGNVTHFKLLKVLSELGVDTTAINLIPSEGGAAALAAFERGDVAMACAFGGALFQMLDLGGNVLMTGAEQEAIGIRVFDIIAIPKSFGEDYPDVVTTFLQITEDANKAYNADRSPFIGTISGAAGMDEAATTALLDTFSFPDKATQLSDAWMGGTVADVMLEQLTFLNEAGEPVEPLDDYSEFINTSFLEDVEG